MADETLVRIVIVPNDHLDLLSPVYRFTVGEMGAIRIRTVAGRTLSFDVEPGIVYTARFTKLFAQGTTVRSVLGYVPPTYHQQGAVVIVVSDTEDLSIPISCLRVVVGGTVRLLLTDGTQQTVVLGNNELTYRNIRRVFRTGTDADGFSNGCLKAAPITYLNGPPGGVPTPQNVTLDPASHSITVSWSPVSEQYATEVQFSEDGEDWVTLSLDAFSPIVQSGLDEGTTYYFRLRNATRDEEPNYSTFVTRSAQTDPPPMPDVDAPEISLDSIDGTEIMIDFVSNGFAGRLQRFQSPNWVDVQTWAASTPSGTITYDPGVDGVYQFRAFNTVVDPYWGAVNSDIVTLSVDTRDVEGTSSGNYVVTSGGRPIAII